MDLFVNAILNDKCLHRLFKWLNARSSLIADLARANVSGCEAGVTGYLQDADMGEASA